MKQFSYGQTNPLDISEHDIVEAMKSIPGYIDITPGDFREVYQRAYMLAVTRLLSSLNAANIMSKSVVQLGRETALVQAASLLAEKRISGAPVVDREGLIVGVVSEKDFLKEMGFGDNPSFMQIATHCLGNKSCMIGRLHNRTVGDIMTAPPITGGKEMTLGAISALFADRGINRLPIVGDDNRPVGMVTRTDLAHCYSSLGEGAGS